MRPRVLKVHMVAVPVHFPDEVTIEARLYRSGRLVPETGIRWEPQPWADIRRGLIISSADFDEIEQWLSKGERANLGIKFITPPDFMTDEEVSSYDPA